MTRSTGRLLSSEFRVRAVASQRCTGTGN